ncbi:MAG: DUF2179 domain-containing protein [Spirochaetes bacterium]|nr:DUF2179 domain-containing protein [Spirochaetota bacterium]
MIITSSELMSMAFIFFARIVDVSLGTIRIILVSRGNRLLAPIIGFLEVFIWITVISAAIRSLHTFLGYVVYAAGFAMGNYVGMLLETKIGIGYQNLRIITSKVVSALPLVLREEGYGVTTVEGQGMNGPVNIIYTVVPKKKTQKVIEIVKMFEPRAFITIDDVRSHHAGFIEQKSIFRSISSFFQKK